MDGTNSAGRKVSLLNDHEPRPCVRLPSFTPSLHSRASSYNCSPIASPPTPPLVRSNSSDSITMETPSPITPDFAFDAGMESPVYQQTGFYPQQKDMSGPYAHHPQVTGPLPYMPAHPTQSVFFPQHPAQEQHPAPPSTASAAGRPKKNSYPCPLAKSFGCNDFFTTSGHAARHAKKHTGKKDAFCPECNKAFTRKDNMEQHRRTHQSGRGSAKTSDRDAKKTKQKAQRPKPSPLQSSAQSSLPMVDPTLPISPAGSYLTPVQQSTEPFVDYSQHRSYPDPTAFAMTHSYTAGSSYGGLDALAIAASGETRTSDS